MNSRNTRRAFFRASAIVGTGFVLPRAAGETRRKKIGEIEIELSLADIAQFAAPRRQRCKAQMESNVIVDRIFCRRPTRLAPDLSGHAKGNECLARGDALMIPAI